MPIYEYRCAACSFQEEYLQKISEPALTQCPVCGKASFQKLLSAAGFHLKGSGWYATDFKTKATKPAAEKKPEAEKKPDAKTETKTETKTTPATTD
jgi:putative FmdB family regulatory protein